MISTRAMGGFLPSVRDWFTTSLGVPTAPQSQAWPLIQEGKHVLIHSPTGTGKTLAAFLSSINRLFEEGPPTSKGVRVLYISPLKALNNDIQRNLAVPLSGIRRLAESRGEDLNEIRTAVRTGDTTPSARASMVRNPPDILITTPESLYLILTSPKARDILKTVETVILDEIHTLADNKRGVHLALSLERLERLIKGFQRIGLSATQRPVEEVARFLGGQDVSTSDGDLVFEPRPVAIVDTDYEKEIVVSVHGMAEGASARPEASIWPNLIPKVLKDVLQHDTTLVFTNSRRQAERTADRLNAQLAIEHAADRGEAPPIDADAFTGGIFGTGHGDGPFMAHHASISDEQRRAMERSLKDGDLPALVGTSSLELGIDIGSIDLVVQLQSPGSVTQGLQRVGRAGHSVGVPSVGKIYATHPEDLFESALIARGMIRREIEETSVPRNSLDILSQQLIAAVSVDDWRVDDLFLLVRSAYPYVDLDRESFENVLKLIAGGYPSTLARALRPRVFWNTQRGTLTALPGARLLALSNSGAIVDRGLFGVYLPDRKTRLGELDEEFVFETRVGDAFVLGSQVWRAREIDDDRVIVEPAPGAMPRMPFWRGEYPWRPYGLSLRLADFRAEIAQQMAPYVDSDDDPPEIIHWLRTEYMVDEVGARQLIGYVRRQLRAVGTISSSDTIIVETYQDPVGDRRMVIQSPFGGRVNAPWSIALAAEIKNRTGVEPELQVGDDGILFRLPDSDAEWPVEIIRELTPEQISDQIYEHLSDSALFGATFRKNAYRALLLPSSRRGGRTPFWLQRLRAKDLQSVARQFDDFPITLETFRDCIEDGMDLPHLTEVVAAVNRGEIDVKVVESPYPSPVAQGLSWQFQDFYLYEWDTPKAERSMQSLQLDRVALSRLFKDPSFAGTLRPTVLIEIEGQSSHKTAGYQVRSSAALAQMLLEVGDLTVEEIADRVDGDPHDWLAELVEQGAAIELEFSIDGSNVVRWVAAQHANQLEAVARGNANAQDVLDMALRYANGRAQFSAQEIVERYGIGESRVSEALELLEKQELLASGYFSPTASEIEWSLTDVITRAQRQTLALLRSEIEPVSSGVYQAFIAKRHGLISTRTRFESVVDASEVLQLLSGVDAPIDRWNEVLFPSRLPIKDIAGLNDRFGRDGEFSWWARSHESRLHVRLFPRGQGRAYLPDGFEEDIAEAEADLSEHATQIVELLRNEGTATSKVMRSALPDLSLANLIEAMGDLVGAGLVVGDSWTALTGLYEITNASSDLIPKRGAGNRRAMARSMKAVTTALPPDVEWSLTTRHSYLGPQLSNSEIARIRAQTLMQRWGVVSRAALQQDSSGWGWDAILAHMNLEELRGTARRGYFVLGLPGIQYASSATVDDLREDLMPEVGFLLNATDIAYVMDDPEDVLSRIHKLRSNTLGIVGGRAALALEENGQRIRTGADTSREAVTALVEAYLQSPRGSARLEVRSWNGDPVMETEGEEILKSVGFRRDYPSMVFDALQARAVSQGRKSS
ncbi:MAG: DEAD/DEAH box helicase [Chloroflexi bacterium]|nr:DEAD/DEAH box helicase [Chloroflexota bacterium]